MSRNHGYMVFDTLYGMDSQFQPQPQMVEGHAVEDDGRRWTITLRDGLTFHDGSRVLARDCVASIRRWAKRDPFGGTLMDATDELAAPSDRTISFRLKQPFPLLPIALGKAGVPVCAMMPERLANTDPFKAITEMVGSGPFRYVADERVPGSLTVYRRFENYVPRPGNTPTGWTAGPKPVHFDRVEWAYIPDPATTTNATINGEAAWQEYAYADMLPLLRRAKNVTVAVNDKTGFVNMMRLNELQPPFDNSAIRRALWPAIDQNAFMQAIVGNDPSLIRNPLGFFGPGTPMASDAGMEVLTSARDPDRAKQALKEAGYKGETVLLMVPSTSPTLASIGAVAADMLKRCGMNVDVYAVEFNAMLSRRARKEPVAQGGWSAYVTNWVGLDWLNPAVHISLRGNGEAAAPGWPSSPKIEELRTQWLTAPDLATQQALCRQIQMQAFEDVPYYPLGAFLQPTAYRNDMITGLNEGFATFWNVRPV
jgi:peptide/nickel transport system substrate-binding protein